MTINEAMSLMSQVKGRLSHLNNMRQQIAVETHWHGDANKSVTPKYDVKKLDAHIVSLENWVWKIEARIKSTNAKTDIGLFDGKDVPVEELLKPIE